MYFKNPFVLLALIFLAIPIIVHLFKLQQFTKIQFTNVKFLKNITLKNRKSSQLKKILVLISRLLTFLFLILAFSQPYLSQNKTDKSTQLIVYIDNSYSMQAKQLNISLFDAAIQDLLKFDTAAPEITLLSNNDIFANQTLEQFRYQLSHLKLSSVPFDYNNALLKISNSIGSKNTKASIFIISDFQKSNQDSINTNLNQEAHYNLIQLKPKEVENFSIDSLYIDGQNATTLTLKVVVKQSYNSKLKPAVSLFDKNLLVAKTVVDKFENQTAIIDFTIKNPVNFIGTINLDDQSLPFDNSLYFVIDKSSKINVLNIGIQSNTLKKLYRDSNFNFTQNPLQNLDYTKINLQQLIILNEIEIIPPMLNSTLTTFLKNGGSLMVIPNIKKELTIYHDLFNALNIQSKLEIVNEKQLITSINYAHPLFENVFEKQIQNFDYPSVDAYVSLKSKSSSSLIKYANGDDFISQLKLAHGYLYFISAPFSPDTNTFVNSPLIVPVFYNIAMQSLATNRLYYIINKPYSIKIEANLKEDEVLSLKNGDNSFIPLQNIKPYAVFLETQDQPDKPGFYEVINNQKTIQNLAFNLNQSESRLNYHTKSTLLSNNVNVTYYTNLDEAIQTFKNNTSIFGLWKICLALSLLFFFTELLLLKFFNR